MAERINRVDRLFELEARSVGTVYSKIMDNSAGRGVNVMVQLNTITLDGGNTPQMTVTIEALENDTLNPVALLANSAAITAVGTYSFTVYPGLAASAGTHPFTANQVLPRKWRVKVLTAVTGGTAPSMTFSASATVIL